MTTKNILIRLKTPSSPIDHHLNRIYLYNTFSKLKFQYECIYRVKFDPEPPNIMFYSHYYSDILTWFHKEEIYDPNVLLLLWNLDSNIFEEEFDIQKNRDYSVNESSFNELKSNNFNTNDFTEEIYKTHILLDIEKSINSWKEASSSLLLVDLHEQIASGGTFDHMHAGHFLLLTLQAMIYKKHSSSRFIVGITGNELLKNKKHGDLIASFNNRSSKVKEILDELRPNMKLDLVELHDPWGPTIIDKDITAIVVSEETFPGSIKINEIRKSKEMNPLQVYVVPCIRAEGEKDKMSSSTIRENIALKKSSHL